MMGPDGGNGGNGGHVVVVGSKVHNTLVHLNSRQIRGGNGEIGKRHGLHGKSIQPSVIKVPLGTLIVNNNNNESVPFFLKIVVEVNSNLKAALGIPNSFNIIVSLFIKVGITIMRFL